MVTLCVLVTDHALVTVPFFHDSTAPKMESNSDSLQSTFETGLGSYVPSVAYVRKYIVLQFSIEQC